MTLYYNTIKVKGFAGRALARGRPLVGLALPARNVRSSSPAPTRQCCGSVEDAALFQFWHLLATNQLKIFASLSMFLEEYRIGEEQSPLLLCAQSLVSRLDLMQCKQPESDDDDEFGEGWGTSGSNGPGSWMR